MGLWTLGWQKFRGRVHQPFFLQDCPTSPPPMFDKMLQKSVARSEGGGDSKIRASSKISKALSPKISICRLCLPFLEVLCGWYIRLWHDDEGNSGCLVWWWQWWWCCLCSCIVAASSGLSQTGFGLHSRDRGVTHRVNQRSRQIYICTELYSCALHRCTYI